MSTNSQTKPRYPIILVPGLGGSQLWMKKDDRLAQKQSPVFPIGPVWNAVFPNPLGPVWDVLSGGGSETDDFESVWINLITMLSNTRKWVENMRLHYDRESHSTENSPGVTIEALNFGYPQSVEILDPRFQKWFWPILQVAAEAAGNAMFPFGTERSLGGMMTGLLLSPVTTPLAALASAKECNDVLKLQTIDLCQGTYHIEELFGDTSQTIQWLPNKTMPASLGFKAPKLILHALDGLSYFYEMTKVLNSRGYVRGKNLRAAPYDFRKAPNELGEFYDKLKTLIEETYTKNGNSPVVMVAHSMGNPVMLYFYNNVVSRRWKDKYVRRHVALAAPWAGAVKPIKLICSGDALGIKFLDRLKMRVLQRSLPCLTFLMPSLAIWPDSEVLVKTAERDYTVNDFKQLFRDLGHREGFSMWKDTHDLNEDLTYPDVEMNCVYGVGVKTPGCLVYKRGHFPNEDPQVVTDDGDGTVNRRSLEAFKKWTRRSVKPVTSWPLQGVEHTEILKDGRVIDYVWGMATRD